MINEKKVILKRSLHLKSDYSQTLLTLTLLSSNNIVYHQCTYRQLSIPYALEKQLQDV